MKFKRNSLNGIYVTLCKDTQSGNKIIQIDNFLVNLI